MAALSDWRGTVEFLWASRQREERLRQEHAAQQHAGKQEEPQERPRRDELQRRQRVPVLPPVADGQAAVSGAAPPARPTGGEGGAEPSPCLNQQRPGRGAHPGEGSHPPPQ